MPKLSDVMFRLLPLPRIKHFFAFTHVKQISLQQDCGAQRLSCASLGSYHRAPGGFSSHEESQSGNEDSNDSSACGKVGGSASGEWGRRGRRGGCRVGAGAVACAGIKHEIGARQAGGVGGVNHDGAVSEESARTLSRGEIQVGVS